MKTKRIFLKLGKEALVDPKRTGFDEDMVKEVARQVRFSVDAGIQVGVAIGGGNFWRGHTSRTIDRTKADQIGMLAIVMNYTYVPEIFRNAGMMTQVLTPFAYGSMTKLSSKDRANKCSKRGTIVFSAGGTGHPCFPTDTGIAFRVTEMEADCVLLAKTIDGVHDSGPKLNPEAKKYDTISIQEAIDRQLTVVDLTTSIVCTEHRIPMAVFSLNEKNGVADAIQGRINGTIVTA